MGTNSRLWAAVVSRTVTSTELGLPSVTAVGSLPSATVKVSSSRSASSVAEERRYCTS